MGSTDRIIHQFKVKDQRAYAYDENGFEIVSVPMTEPFHERQAWDAEIGAIRNNTP
jgi:hypothetical protein